MRRGRPAGPHARRAGAPGPNEVRVNGVKTERADGAEGHDRRPRDPSGARRVRRRVSRARVAAGRDADRQRPALLTSSAARRPATRASSSTACACPASSISGSAPRSCIPRSSTTSIFSRAPIRSRSGASRRRPLRRHGAASRSRTRADWTLRLFDAGALVEAPFGKQADGSPPRGSALVSGRYGYPGLLLSIFAPNAGLAYWDYQARVTYKLLRPRRHLASSRFGSYDSVSQRDETEQNPGRSPHRGPQHPVPPHRPEVGPTDERDRLARGPR